MVRRGDSAPRAGIQHLYETGHVAISPRSFKDSLDFLDKYIGPAK
jgi:hypothetical protein